MKIKTITCHNVYNFGATLQAYALMKYLQELGHDTRIIDYRPEYLSYNLWAIGPRWRKNFFLKLLYFAYVVPKRLLMKKRRAKFDLFNKNRLNLTTKTYHSFQELKESPPRAEIFFAGSDQIWNTETPNGRDPSFYLEFAPGDAIKASYAASFSVSQIKPELKQFVKTKLFRLNAISVREDTGLKILNELGISNGTVVVDPVFLPGKKQWEDLANFNTKEKYVFVYDQENNPLIKKAALKLAKENNLKVFAIESLYPMTYADRKIRDAGPEEFLGLIKNCEVCLTNSFHCIGFSIIFNKKFYLFKRTHQKVNSRMIDLLSYLNLSNRIGDENFEKLSLEEIDYSLAVELLEKRRQISLNYIHSVIAKVRENA